MNNNEKSGNKQPVSFGVTVRQSCATSCQKALTQLREIKTAIFTESRRNLKTPEQWVRVALNEAEALAWETHYPLLLFPALAAEKVQSLTGWNARQLTLRRGSHGTVLAA